MRYVRGKIVGWWLNRCSWIERVIFLFLERIDIRLGRGTMKGSID